MDLLRRLSVLATLIIILHQTSVEADPIPRCPLNFNLTYSTTKEPYCYKLKGPEKSSDTNDDCIGNLYTIKLYNDLVFVKKSIPLWTEYKTAYPTGPYVDWSFTENRGKLLDTISTDVQDLLSDETENLCVFLNAFNTYVNGYCSVEKTYYRYCIVKPYPVSVQIPFGDVCESFTSPRLTCLVVINQTSSRGVSWGKSKDLCETRGQLLTEGWIYTNILPVELSPFPLGVIYYPNHTLIEATDNHSIPSSSWKFVNNKFPEKISYGAVNNMGWDLVNDLYNFKYVICEKSRERKVLDLQVKIDEKNIIALFINVTDKVDIKYISCFTDSETFYPTRVNISYEKYNKFILTSIADGYYWCIVTDSINYIPTESSKTLFIRDKEAVKTRYAVKIMLENDVEYTLDNVKNSGSWKDKLWEYINAHSKNASGVTTPLRYLKLKQVSRLVETILVHVGLDENMSVVSPNTYIDGITVLDMKPVHYCTHEGLLFNDSLTLDCVTHECTGNFNEGVNAVRKGGELCKTTTPAPTLSLKEQLQQVIRELEMVINDTVMVPITKLAITFHKLSNLLQPNVSLEIPGRLPQLLDRIGTKIDFSGSENATTVHDNIALLVVDASPNTPVRVLRITTRDTDVFTENSFQILKHDVNASYLQPSYSEAVVELPASVSTSQRRISFVAFRNNRTFQNSRYSINSRILSINIENLTRFEHEELLHIHFAPLTKHPSPNWNRSCGFWRYNNGGSGDWSQDGCTFIAASTNTLDTCSCNHLTHFAEILIPKIPFSDQNDTILEILTLIGCCLSMIGLAIVGLTALFFSSWRRDFINKIWLQLCVAIFIVVLSFFVIILAKFDTFSRSCIITGVTLHYSVLVSFGWMLVAAIVSYRRLVLVFSSGSSHNLCKLGMLTWGTPCVIVGVTLSVDLHSYARHFDAAVTATSAESFCYPSGPAFWLTVFAPIVIILLVNLTLFLLILRSVRASRKVQRFGDNQNESLRYASMCCLMVFLFGLPWFLGLLSFNVVAAYFFTITATFQGFLLFVFFVLGNQKTRDLWLNKFRSRQTSAVPVNYSTDTNRSTAKLLNSASAENKSLHF